MTNAPTENPQLARFADRAARFTAVLQGAAGRWDAVTPCDGWTVRDVVDHVVETQRDFLTRHDLPLPARTPDQDPAATWQTHRAAVEALLAGEGVAARRYDGWFGPTTIGDTMVDFYGWDLLVHGWDVARATGQELVWPDELVADLEATADGWGDSLYGEGICRPPVELTGDATPQDRLLARLGRDPRWTAPEPVR
ncbi:TIGR03086 family protein [Auraticoccus sp. F435]|uniref:TIGR03086 family protein n=1 Tax=Auraticoccus cholistanensis TaxID=2656650 RepID=A0A6A9V193_9ACTN|nr:TIGR03086 family metal-binding protein [Auraticoccus cholistanensis]MVA76700.1 TIGR03086 family protein [Auraticoccus cholistanensis]